MPDIYGLVTQLKASAQALDKLPGAQKAVVTSEEFSRNYNELLAATKALDVKLGEVVWPPNVEKSTYVEVESYLNQLVAIIENCDEYDMGPAIL